MYDVIMARQRDNKCYQGSGRVVIVMTYPVPVATTIESSGHECQDLLTQSSYYSKYPMQ